VIRMTRNEVRNLGCDEMFFKRVVKTVFNQRRKMLRVSLRQLFLGEGASAEFYAGELMTKRPEQLSVAQFVALTNQVEAELKRIQQQES
ncbi:MAG: 16S rRNA (adenine(1518)-N(6)/adenine(1519)-N(6))-dimethyltransferase, partial [Hoylesella buccalis]